MTQCPMNIAIWRHASCRERGRPSMRNRPTSGFAIIAAYGSKSSGVKPRRTSRWVASRGIWREVMGAGPRGETFVDCFDLGKPRRDVIRQHLDRDVALEARVAGAIDLAHTARAERSAMPFRGQSRRS